MHAIYAIRWLDYQEKSSEERSDAGSQAADSDYDVDEEYDNDYAENYFDNGEADDNDDLGGGGGGEDGGGMFFIKSALSIIWLDHFLGDYDWISHCNLFHIASVPYCHAIWVEVVYLKLSAHSPSACSQHIYFRNSQIHKRQENWKIRK